jgi:hypothetical protein
MAGRVELTEGEVAAARRCAATRLLDAQRKGAKDRMGANSEESHFWGALGEIAVAKYIDLRWTCSSMTWAARDVGRYEVRSVKPGTSPYVKSKPNDPPSRAVALVLFRSETVASVVGWITAERIRELGTKDDPGGVGAPAWFLRDLSHLDPVFPEIRMPWEEPEETVKRNFPLRRNENGSIEAVASTCPDCGKEYLIHTEHVRTFDHRKAVAASQTLGSQMTIPEEPQPAVYKFTYRPKVDFGTHLICPRCKGFRKKVRGIRDEMCMDPRDHKIVCSRCNGWGVIPNIGPVAPDAKP